MCTVKEINSMTYEICLNYKTTLRVIGIIGDCAFIFNLLCCLELFYYHLSCRMYICVFFKVLNMNVKRKHFGGYFLSHPPVLFVSSVSFISLDFDYLKLVGIQYSWQYSPGNCNIYEKHFILLHFSSYTYFTL